ncbi:hypothetical protein BDV93DRAFT_529803, partial [Ceratobasidium sp. AG-I]
MDCGLLSTHAYMVPRLAARDENAIAKCVVAWMKSIAAGKLEPESAKKFGSLLNYYSATIVGHKQAEEQHMMANVYTLSSAAGARFLLISAYIFASSLAFGILVSTCVLVMLVVSIHFKWGTNSTRKN